MTSFFLFFMAAVIIAGLIFLLTKKKNILFYESSIDADAIVLNIQLTGVCVKNEIQAIIQLQVQPERDKSFIAEIKQMLTAMDYTRLPPGTKIVVKYNARNHKDLFIPKEGLSNIFKVNAEVV